MKYSLIVYDCDGVLVDSKESNRLFYNDLLSKIGRQLMSEEELDFVHCHTAIQSVEFLFSNYQEKLGEAKDMLSSMDYFSYLPYHIPEPGIKEVISKIRPPVKTAVFTNRTTTTIELMKLMGFTNYFDMILCALDVKPKPDSEGLFLLMNSFNLVNNEVLFIGDSYIDEHTAKSADIDFVAYKNKKLDADYYIEHHYEVIDILELNL